MNRRTLIITSPTEPHALENGVIEVKACCGPIEASFFHGTLNSAVMTVHPSQMR